MAAIQRKRSKTTPEKIDEIIDWRPIKKILDQKLERKANAVGNPAYPALGMFKALLLQSWYSLSDRELSENLEDRISFSHFCGFSLHHQVPDNSTICRFRNELHQKGLAKPLLDMINAQIQAGGWRSRRGSSWTPVCWRVPGGPRSSKMFSRSMKTAMNQSQRAAAMMWRPPTPAIPRPPGL